MVVRSNNYLLSLLSVYLSLFSPLRSFSLSFAYSLIHSFHVGIYLAVTGNVIMIAFISLAGGISPFLASFILFCYFHAVVAEEVTAFKSVRSVNSFLYLLGNSADYYYKRPDLFAPTFTLEVSDTRKLSPGYIFVGPYETTYNPGPYLYDNNGVCQWLCH